MHGRRSACTFIAALALSTAGCRTAGSSLSPADIEAHRAMSQEFLDHMHAAGWVALSNMYRDDAVVMQPHRPALRGRQAIHDFWAAMPAIKELRFIDDGITGEGDIAYVYGRYWMTFADPAISPDQGKYLDVRRRQPDGSWKYVAEMANSSLPRTNLSQ